MQDLSLRTKSFALRVIKLFSSLPKTIEAQIIGKQFIRSGMSVGSHYREAVNALKFLDSLDKRFHIWHIISKQVSYIEILGT